MTWLYLALAVVLGLLVLVAVTGALLPKAHAAARAITLRQPAAAVFATLADRAAMPQWRKDLKSVQELPAKNGKRCWREVSGFGPMDLMVERELPDREIVLRIVTERSPFGGTWTFLLAPKDGGTEVAVTENGEVYNVFFRALARFVFGYKTTIDGFLRALGAKFGEQVVTVDAKPAPAPS